MASSKIYHEFTPAYVSWGTTLSATTHTGSQAIIMINANIAVLIWMASTSNIAALAVSEKGIVRKADADGTVQFTSTETGANFNIKRDSGTSHFTIIIDSNATIKAYL